MTKRNDKACESTIKMIKALRYHYDIDVGYIASTLDVTPNTVYRWSRGDTAMPKPYAQLLMYHVIGKMPDRNPPTITY